MVGADDFAADAIQLVGIEHQGVWVKNEAAEYDEEKYEKGDADSAENTDFFQSVVVHIRKVKKSRSFVKNGFRSLPKVCVRQNNPLVCGVFV